MMIELQCINNIIDQNNIAEYLEQGIDVQYFTDHKDQWDFILQHYKTYNKVPDLATFLSVYPDFEVFQVAEPAKYLIDKLKEEHLFELAVNLFNQSAEILKENSYEGLRNIIAKGEKLLFNNTITEGTDINQLVSQKVEDIRSKQGCEGILGISSGLPELDYILGGWLPGEELVTIVGRVNQGKSWLLQKFLTSAHTQGKRVLLYSGEMGAMQVAYRHDTLGMNYSNRQLTRGTISEFELQKYKEDLQKRADELQPFMVITPKDIGGQYMTVSMLRTLIKKYNPDIVGIDQLSLMSDERRGENKRIQLSNITMDLFRLSEDLSIPILADAQANRNTTKTEEPENPELADIGESDAIGQNSSRVISLVQTKLGLSILVTKNRYGENNKKLIYSWDIDLGTFRFVTQEENGNSNSTPTKNEPPLPYSNIKVGQDVIDIF